MTARWVQSLALQTTMNISDIYRSLPRFKGKKRMGAFLFKNQIHNKRDLVVPCRSGLKFHLLNTYDSVGRDLFFDGEYEPATIRVIEQNLKAGDVFIDAGANIGAISLPVAKRNNVKVYSFEPGPHIFSILEKNKIQNKLENVETIQKGLSESEGEADFYESDRVHGWSGMVKIDSFQKYRVITTSLDIFAAEKQIERIAVLKADVQGWEYYVFKGAERLIDEGKIENIIFEFEWWAEKNAGLEIGAAQQFLLDKGYSLMTLKGHRIESPILEGSLVLHAFR